MIMTTTQKIIRIGSSNGVTLPAKKLKQLGVEIGDEIEITFRATKDASVEDAQAIANSILDRYDDDFRNLAER